MTSPANQSTRIQNNIKINSPVVADGQAVTHSSANRKRNRNGNCQW